ncbi:unnamed protein product, partial [Meganyctiphanes norvegica]
MAQHNDGPEPLYVRSTAGITEANQGAFNRSLLIHTPVSSLGKNPQHKDLPGTHLIQPGTHGTRPKSEVLRTRTTEENIYGTKHCLSTSQQHRTLKQTSNSTELNLNGSEHNIQPRMTENLYGIHQGRNMQNAHHPENIYGVKIQHLQSDQEESTKINNTDYAAEVQNTYNSSQSRVSSDNQPSGTIRSARQTSNPLVKASGPSQHETHTAHVQKLPTSQIIYGQIDPANRYNIQNSQSIYGHTVSQQRPISHQMSLPPIPHPSQMVPPGTVPHGSTITHSTNHSSYHDIYGHTTAVSTGQPRIYGQIGDQYNIYGISSRGPPLGR